MLFLNGKNKELFESLMKNYPLATCTHFNNRVASEQADSLDDFATKRGLSINFIIEQLNRAGITGIHSKFQIDQFYSGAFRAYLASIESRNLIRAYESSDKNIDCFKNILSITNEVLASIARRPTLLYELDSQRFEELVARLLEDQGCEISLTKRTRDGGFDIFGRIRNSVASPIFLAECKRYSSDRKVGVEFVRGLYGVTEANGANIGLLITSSSFTRDAMKEKLRIGSRIELKDFNDLCTWLTPYKS